MARASTSVESSNKPLANPLTFLSSLTTSCTKRNGGLAKSSLVNRGLRTPAAGSIAAVSPTPPSQASKSQAVEEDSAVLPSLLLLLLLLLSEHASCSAARAKS
jgi:hypothetical protein